MTEPPSLASAALGGIAWNWASSVVLVVAQVASTTVTARLVSPDQFGLYATAQAAAGFAGYFTMAAVGPGLQRRSRLGARTVGTALTLSLAGSLLVAAVLWLGAGSWARVWGVPDAAGVVRVIAISLFMFSAATVPVALIRRRLQFRRVTIIETTSLVVGLTVGIGLAIALHSAVALAIGQAVGAFALLLATGVVVRAELRLSFDRADARELRVFASQVGGLGLFQYLSNIAPSWFAGRVFGPSLLGVYSRANLIASLPAEYAATSIYKVIYPLYGRVRDDLARTKALLGEALTLTTGFVWPLFALIAGASPVIVAVLLGPRWDGAASLLTLSALLSAAYVPAGLLTNAAEAFGWMRIIAARQVAFFVGLAATLAVAYVADLSMNWLLAGLAVSQWAAYALTIQPFVRRGFLDSRLVLGSQLIHATVAVAAFGAAAGCAWLLDELPLLAQVAGQLAIGGVVAAAVLLGRSWLPAAQVLARRMGAAPDESLMRVGLRSLRSEAG